jgi:hypothetical protein
LPDGNLAKVIRRRLTPQTSNGLWHRVVGLASRADLGEHSGVQPGSLDDLETVRR